MEVIELPLVPIDVSSSDARKLMQASSCAAVIVSESTNYWLFKANLISWGASRKLSGLSDLPRMHHVYEVTQQDISSRFLDIHDPARTGKNFEDLLDQVGRLYAIISFMGSIPPGPSTGRRIVTRHEDLKHEISSGPRDCYCLGMRQHDYPPPKVKHGDSCRTCGAQITCS